jgi:hypothetical protein
MNSCCETGSEASPWGPYTRSNSTGGRYPDAECSRLRLDRLENMADVGTSLGEVLVFEEGMPLYFAAS